MGSIPNERYMLWVEVSIKSVISSIFKNFFRYKTIFKLCDFYCFSILPAAPVPNVSFDPPDVFAIPKLTDMDGSLILQLHNIVEFQYKHRFCTQDPIFRDFSCF